MIVNNNGSSLLAMQNPACHAFGLHASATADMKHREARRTARPVDFSHAQSLGAAVVMPE